MTTVTTFARNVTAPRTALPHLSHSRVNRYLLCPEQYRLYYLEGLRPRIPAANLVFGQVVHAALAQLFQEKGDPILSFREGWNALGRTELTYSRGDSWVRLRDVGEALLRKFISEELPRLAGIAASEKPFTLDITSLDLPFVGVVDLVADLDGKRTVIDFKTAGARYGEHEAALSDQLIAYRLAEPEAEQAALCVLVKTREPRIDWLPVKGRGEQATEYLVKLGMVATDIAAGRFYKRPGKWCSWCDYLPVCLGDEATVAQTLIRTP